MQTGYSVVRLSDGAERASSPVLPVPFHDPGPPRVRAVFTAVGGEVGGHRLVQREHVQQPSRLHRAGVQSVTFDGEKVVVNPGWVADLATARAIVVAEIKQAARSLILSIYPEWRQANMTARGVELQDLWRRNGAWTAEEAAEAAALQAAWAWIKSVRTHSGVMEAEATALSTVEALAAWAPHDWPVTP